jgi:hypothetical protein
MEVSAFLRVVALKKGKLKPAEFKLREGEQGLSLFAHGKQPAPADVIEAVRAAGKQGELGVAVLPRKAIEKLGLKMIRTPGGTPVEEVNAIHYEARFPIFRRFFLRLRGVRLHEYFNEHLSDQLFRVAQLPD